MNIRHSRKEYYWDIGGRLIFLELYAYVITAHSGHYDIQQDYIRRRFLDDSESGFSVHRGDYVISIAQSRFQDIYIQFGIVDYQY
jgi:hypothetical protein